MEFDDMTIGQVFKELCREDAPGIKRLFFGAPNQPPEEVKGYDEMALAAAVRLFGGMPEILTRKAATDADINLFKILKGSQPDLKLQDVRSAMDAAAEVVRQSVKQEYTRGKNPSSKIFRG